MISVPLPTVFAERTLMAMFPGLNPEKVEWNWEEEGRVLEAEFLWRGMNYAMEINVNGEFVNEE